jgi:putative acetyltransferase
VIIEPESAADRAAIHAVHSAAFPTRLEADLVDALRASGHAIVSLVARLDGVVVGHVLLSPVTISRDGEVVANGLGLAPVAVLPAHQSRGIGGALVRAALARATAPFCVVLGDPAYYSRFGFTRALDRGVTNEYGVDAEFMVTALPGGAPPPPGLARYGAEFASSSSA